MHIRKQGFSENFDVPVIRNQRLRSLLPLWKESRYWHANESRSHYLLEQDGFRMSKSDTELWSKIIRLSQCGYSTTQSDWEQRYSHIPLPQPSAKRGRDETKRQYNAIGARLAWRTPKPASWILIIDPKQTTEGIKFYVDSCKKHFREVVIINGVIHASVKLSSTFHDDASLLCLMAAQDERPAQLHRIWTIACALHCEMALAEMLPSVVGQQLSLLLLEELRPAAPSLTLDNDVKIEMYSGHALDKFDKISSHFTRFRPASPLGDMLHAHDIWNTHFPRTDFEDERDYYNAVVRTIIMASDKEEIIQCLNMLPPGRTLLHAIDTIQNHKPWMLLSLLNDSTSFVAGIFGILTLPTHRLDGPADLTEEYYEVQQLLRSHVIGSTYPYYIQESIALGLNDEYECLNSRSRYRNDVLQIEEKKQLHIKLIQPLNKILNLELGPAKPLINALRRHLEQKSYLTIADIAFSIRILSIVKDTKLQSELCHAIVISYFELLNKKDVSITFSFPIIDDQPMMCILGKFLRRAENVASWQVWISAWENLLNQLSAIEGSTDENQIRQQFELRDKISIHLNHIVFQLPSLDDEAVIQVINILLRLYEAEKLYNAKYGLFTWTSGLIAPFSTGAQEPFLVQLGKHMAKLDRIGVVMLARIKSSNPSPLEIAQLLWGLHGNVHLVDKLSEGLSDLVKTDLAQSHAIGYLKPTAIAMYRAGNYDEAYLYATELLKVVDKDQSHVTWDYKLLAKLIMLAILVSKEKFADAALIDIPSHDIDKNRYCEFQNLRALALIGMQDFDAAKVHLDNALKISEDNSSALSNLVFLYLRKKQWQEVITTALQARERLGSDCPISITQYEVIACWECGDRQRVARLLEQLPTDFNNKPSILKIRIGLLMSAVADKSELEKYLLYLDKEDPIQSSALRAQLAATGRHNFLNLSELAGWPRSRVSLSQRLDGNPEKYLDDSFVQCCTMLAGRPDLTEVLSEDQLTLMLIWLYQPLLGVGIQMRAHPEGGHGPLKGGIADFAIESVDNFQNPTVLVRGEAKKWDGLDTLDQGIRQVFGTSNTYSEIFLAVVVYYLGNDYPDCVKKITDFLPKFTCVQEGLATYNCIEFERVQNRKAPAITFRSVHRVSELNRELYPDRVLYTYVIDMKTSLSKGLRVSSTKSSKGKTAKGGKPTITPSAKSPRGKAVKGGSMGSSS